MDAESAPGVTSRLDAERRRLLAELRRCCPGVLPGAPLPPGEFAPQLPVRGADLSALVTTATREAAAGRPLVVADQLPGIVVWEDGAEALLLDLDTIRVRLDEGMVVVRVDVRCDQVRGAAPVEVRTRVEVRSAAAGVLDHASLRYPDRMR